MESIVLNNAPGTDPAFVVSAPLPVDGPSFGDPSEFVRGRPGGRGRNAFASTYSYQGSHPTWSRSS